MKNKYKEILISIIPAIVFMLLYRNISFTYAVVTGFGMGIIIYTYKYLKEKKLSTLNYIGIFGLIIQTIISLFAENPKTYFLYPIISNGIYAFVFGFSLFVKRDLVSVISKNMCETEEAYTLLRPAFRSLTLLWFLFFSIKTLIKLVGLSSFSFESLFTINWILGTPISLLLLWFSYWYPDKYYFKRVNNITKNLKENV